MFTLLTFDTRVYEGHLKAAPVFPGRRDHVSLPSERSNQTSDLRIATPISEEGLSGCEGSGSGGALEEALASVSFGLSRRYV